MGRILEIQVLQQLKTELKHIKRGTIFRVLTDEGTDGSPRIEESPWQVALEDAVVKDNALSLRSEQLHLIVGKPEPLEFRLEESNLTKTDLRPKAPETAPADVPKH